jgi:hypothetical protein
MTDWIPEIAVAFLYIWFGIKFYLRTKDKHD